MLRFSELLGMPEWFGLTLDRLAETLEEDEAAVKIKSILEATPKGFCQWNYCGRTFLSSVLEFQSNQITRLLREDWSLLNLRIEEAALLHRSMSTSGSRWRRVRQSLTKVRPDESLAVSMCWEIAFASSSPVLVLGILRTLHAFRLEVERLPDGYCSEEGGYDEDYERAVFSQRERFSALADLLAQTMSKLNRPSNVNFQIKNRENF
jgi:hypothetical protein